MQKLPKYPFSEGDDYYTIEDGIAMWSCWDQESEMIYDNNPYKIYFPTYALAQNYLQSPLLSRTHAEIFLEYWNDWLSSKTMAEYYSICHETLDKIISQGKIQHDQSSKTTIELIWENTYGEKMKEQYPVFVNTIKQQDIYNKEEILKVWKTCYNEDLKIAYPSVYEQLT